jgi:hypothetical protein
MSSMNKTAKTPGTPKTTLKDDLTNILTNTRDGYGKLMDHEDIFGTLAKGDWLRSKTSDDIFACLKHHGEDMSQMRHVYEKRPQVFAWRIAKIIRPLKTSFEQTHLTDVLTYGGELSIYDAVNMLGKGDPYWHALVDSPIIEIVLRNHFFNPHSEFREDPQKVAGMLIECIIDGESGGIRDDVKCNTLFYTTISAGVDTPPNVDEFVEKLLNEAIEFDEHWFTPVVIDTLQQFCGLKMSQIVYSLNGGDYQDIVHHVIHCVENGLSALTTEKSYPNTKFVQAFGDDSPGEVIEGLMFTHYDPNVYSKNPIILATLNDVYPGINVQNAEVILKIIRIIQMGACVVPEVVEDDADDINASVDKFMRQKCGESYDDDLDELSADITGFDCKRFGVITESLDQCMDDRDALVHKLEQYRHQLTSEKIAYMLAKDSVSFELCTLVSDKETLIERVKRLKYERFEMLSRVASRDTLSLRTINRLNDKIDKSDTLFQSMRRDIDRMKAELKEADDRETVLKKTLADVLKENTELIAARDTVTDPTIRDEDVNHELLETIHPSGCTC